MKLRILDNYIRLRLSQSDIDAVKKTGQVQRQTNFGDNSLSYILAMDESISDVMAHFSDNTILISVPTKVAEKWLEPEEVGIENLDQRQIRILIEKDFECLHKRPGEDDKDTFPNPMAK